MTKSKIGSLLYLLTHILIFSSLYSTYQIILPHLENNYLNYILTIFVIPFFTLLTLISYERAVFTNPGPITIKIIPLKLQATNPDLYGKSCRKCDNWKPPRAHHCSRCDTCVFKMDHHCEWINNCNGSHNQKYFILFLLYNIILTILIGYIHIIGCISWSLRIRKNLLNTIFTFTANKMIVISIFLVCGFFIIFISQMLFDQVEALKDNQTVVESHKGQCGRPQSISFTMKQVFGQNKWLWFLPIKSQILLNYAELIYSPDYTCKSDSMYIEDCIYDPQSEIYQHFIDFQVDTNYSKQAKNKNQ